MVDGEHLVFMCPCLVQPCMLHTTSHHMATHHSTAQRHNHTTCLFSFNCHGVDCRYERKPPCAFKNIIDTQIVSAMGPPGGGRNPVSARVLRHFNILSFTELSDDSVGRIFTAILGAFLQRNFGAEIGELTDKV